MAEARAVINIPVLTINYETEYCEAPSSVSHSGGGDVTLSASDLPEIEADGHQFVGWSYNGEIISEGYELYVDSDMTITLVGVWEEKQIYVISDYMELKEIADQLRALTDKTEDMSLSEMAAEAGSANNHKTDIMFALSEKGVDTTGAGLAEIAGLVAAIQTGEEAFLSPLDQSHRVAILKELVLHMN